MSEEKLHPVSLGNIFFVRSSVIAIPGHDRGSGAISATPVNHLQVAPVEGQSGRYSASMRTTINPSMESSSPYFVDMECLAELTVDDATLTPEEAVRGVTITAHSVLYGAIRESVAWLTSRQPYGTLVLGLSVLKPTAEEDVESDRV